MSEALKAARRRLSLNGSVEQFLRSGLQIEPNILVRFVARDRRDALHEVEDALGFVALLRQHGLDDFCRLGLAEATLAQKVRALLVGSSDDPLARRPDAVDEAHGRGLGETVQRGCGLVGETRGGISRVADGDFLEIFDAPEVPILTNGAQVEAGDPKRFGANLGVPAIETTEVEIGRTIGQPPRFDRIEVVN
jgi:hypothetical protein